MLGLGLLELVLLLGIVLFVFGWGRLPQLGRNLRQAIRNFKATAQGADEIDVTPGAPNDSEGKGSCHGR